MKMSSSNNHLFKPAIPIYWPIILLTGFVMIAPTYADWSVWTLTGTERVLRSNPPGDSRQVKLAAARNEWESFQILMRSDRQVKGVRVEPGELRGGRGAVLDSNHTRLFRQHQLYINAGTYRNPTFKPDWFPDPLIPFRHPVSAEKLEGARFRAIPFDLPANETHGFWVDLYVPDNATPGEYRGTYRVTSESDQSMEIPVSLTVWDFNLPRVSTLVTAFGSPAQRMRDYYRQRAKAGKEPEPKNWTAIEIQCAQLLTEHHINATPPSEYLWPVAQQDGSFRIPAEQLRLLREFVDRYHVNALEIPHPSSVVKDPERERDKLRAWLAAFDQAAKELNRPYIIFYTYLKDEPNTEEDYRYVQKWGHAIREAKSVVKVLVVEQTWTEPGNGGADSAWGDLYGSVDIWCPLFSLHRQDSAAQRQALGEMIWTYTALCQGEPTPWWHIDYPLLNYRVPAWIAWRYRMRGLLYWGGMSYWREAEDPWSQADTYHKELVFNGEGTLVYPARPVGYDGIVSSLRLKALRDSIEDYEYLAILERLGKAAEAEKIVLPVAQSWFGWEKDPAAYETARTKLAQMNMAETKPNATPVRGPLRVHPTNPRYFTDGTKNHDGSLKAIYLTGSHTWNNLQDSGPIGKPLTSFDYDAYLSLLQSSGHNFMRMWAWEGGVNEQYYEPLVYCRTGPGLALDGKPKFDLTKFNQDHFDRLRARVKAAGSRGIYVSIMLFQGWSIYNHDYGNPWPLHPYNKDNNINGINGDTNGDGEGKEVHTLQTPAITALQEVYIRKVVDTVNDLDNVLYEITNETAIFSKDWQYHIIRFIKAYQAAKPKQHPVGVTAFDSGREGSMAALLGSPADWISPQNDGVSGDYMNDPPPADGRKVIISDTDHLWGVGGDRIWVWKSFTRGLNPIYMDPLSKPDWVRSSEAEMEGARKAMGDTRRYAERMNLSAMTPHKELSSTRYCLAKPGAEYLVYQPENATFIVKLLAGIYTYEWFNPSTGEVVGTGSITASDPDKSFTPPFTGDAVLYLKTHKTKEGN